MRNLGVGRNFARLGTVLFAAAMAMACMPGEASARQVRHLAHHRTLKPVVQNAQASLNESSHLGTMRYYGGPKSPMWRDVR